VYGVSRFVLMSIYSMCGLFSHYSCMLVQFPDIISVSCYSSVNNYEIKFQGAGVSVHITN